MNNSSYERTCISVIDQNGVERCEFIHAHEEIVKKVNEQMPDDEILYDLAELFKIFGDSTRIKILYVLFESEMCVCDIAQLLNMTQSAISHQLRALKQSKLVKYRRDGKTVFYSLADSHVRTILGQGMEHVAE
ncbi:ArsR/SmtB family transcription factor [Harryflintia acetispora]|uniref:ArsR/SmtB family transcription factor n=1 Tax=Harryflintia acetispora TaxID=1849041 RepID=UPI0033075A46